MIGSAPWMKRPAGNEMKAGRSLTRSSKSLLGRLVSAAVRALPTATSAVVTAAPSMRSRCSMNPPSSTIATVTFQLCLAASAMHAAIIVFTSADVRHGFVRIRSLPQIGVKVRRQRPRRQLAPAAPNVKAYDVKALAREGLPRYVGLAMTIIVHPPTLTAAVAALIAG